MARRIDIELTSARPDGTWTWRAAGALQPRGMLDGALLYEGAKAGDVVRAEAEFELDGITITGVLPPKEKKRNEPERLEVLGPPRAHQPAVSASLTSRPGTRRPDGGARPPRRGPDARPGNGETAGRPQRGRPSDRPSRAPSGSGERTPRAEDEGGAEGRRPRRPRDGEVGQGGQRPARRDATAPRGGREQSAPQAAEPAARPRARRLNPANTHRTAVLDSLPPEQRPIAEQVLRGGIPAVRTAIHLEREKATAEGRTPPNADALLAIAEELLPRLKAAEWRDRAEAAVKIADELGLRDLRSVVAGADVARDEEGRRLAAALREALERRVEQLRQSWVSEVEQNLEEGRVVRALRMAARPPEPATRLPAELATALSEAAGTAMDAHTPPDRWAALLDAVIASPVRRAVKPMGLPDDAPEALLQTARQSSGRVPALAALLGIAMPPPPGPPRPPGRPARPRPAGARAGSRKTRPEAPEAAGSPPASGTEIAPGAEADTADLSPPDGTEIAPGAEPDAPPPTSGEVEPAPQTVGDTTPDS